MTLGLWGGQKVVSLEKWFNKEALDKLAEVRRGLKADAKAKNPRKYRNESNVRKSNLEFLCIPNRFADEIQARIEKAADIVLGQVNKGLKRFRKGLSRTEGKLREKCNKLWKELRTRLSLPPFSNPWTAWKAKKTLLTYMHNYLLMKQYGEYLAAMEG